MKWLIFSTTQKCDNCGEEMRLDAGETPTGSIEVYVECVNKKCSQRLDIKLVDRSLLMKEVK